MRLTNELGLPEPVVRAVSLDPYSKGDADFSATELLKPPQVRHLYEKHQDDIVEDVSDRFWALLGKSVHAILEAAALPEEHITEERLFAEIVVDGQRYRISGAIDFQGDDTIEDYKVTSCYKIIRGDYDDWTAQLNIYNWLAHKNGKESDTRELRVNAILRDWMKSKQNKSDYPQSPMVVCPMIRWPVHVTEEFIAERIRDHVAVPVRPCSAEETWGGKRCKDWCGASPFCPQVNSSV